MPWVHEDSWLRNASFLRFWAGQTLSLYGSRVTAVALPLTAVLVLHAGAVQMGVLTALGSLAYLAVGLPAGLWVDRLSPRSVLVYADAGRAVLLLSIPAAALLGALTLVHVYLVATCTAILSVFFDVAQQSLVPAIVPADRLVDANSKLEMSDSLAQIAGPGLGGLLVQTLTAPVAIAADGVSFIVSAVSLLFVESPPAAPAPPAGRHVGQEMLEGLVSVVRHAGLRGLVGASTVFNVFDDMLFAVYVLYMTRTLHLESAQIGLVFGLGGIGGLLGAALAEWVTFRVGLRRVLIGSIGIASLGELFIAGASGPALRATVMLIVAEELVEWGATVYGINSVSLRQSLTAPQLRGRVNGAARTLTWGLGSIGALVGGVIGQDLGLRAVVIIAGVGTLFAAVPLLASPVGRSTESVTA